MAALTLQRLKEITDRYARLTVAVAGDFCLDRYFEIDPARTETSLETNLPAWQVVNVRGQPGGAGCVTGNVAALAPRAALAVGFCGEDGEGMELRRGLERLGVDTRHFLATPDRHTFTYGKPLLMHPGRPPEELSRLDIKNWSPTPPAVVERICEHLGAAVEQADAIIMLEQVDHRNTGALPRPVKALAAQLAAKAGAGKVFVGDSRCAVDEYANVNLKINRGELLRHFGQEGGDRADLKLVQELAVRWAGEIGRNVIITLADEGILAAEPNGTLHRAGKIPTTGEIDIVGAGDCVLANLTVALAAGATLGEAVRIANLAASVVIKKLGTTGTASIAETAAALEALGGQYE